MKKALLFSLVLLIAARLPAQEKAANEFNPRYYVNTDLVYDVESIPKLGFEYFFTSHNRLKGWQVDLAYQIHYSDQFGIATSHGDRISIGVYQGPTARIGYNVYSRKHKKNWQKYFAPALCLKYLWYDKETVNTGRHKGDQAYRIQSERCYAPVPQFVIGGKRLYKHFCADFYVGLQFPIKFRDKTIYYEQDSRGIENINVPYGKNVTTVTPGPVFGIKLGYIQWKEKRSS